MPGYHYPMPQSPDFTDITASAPLRPPFEMFGPYGMTAGAPFTMPDNLSETLDTYYALPPSTRQRFVRSCYWLQYANHAFLHSSSSAFMAVVTAAEVLFPPPPTERCTTCGQQQYRLRSAFARLLDHSSRSSQVTASERIVRSRHVLSTSTTRDPALRTAATSGGGISFRSSRPAGSQDDDDLRTLLRITPYTLAQWLREQDTIPRVELSGVKKNNATIQRRQVIEL